MSSKPNNNSPERPTEAKPSKTKDPNIDVLKSIEALQKRVDSLDPLIEFLNTAEELNDNDVSICWNVMALRGNGTSFAHLKGSSTLHQALADNMIANTPSRAGKEMMDKVVLPMTSIFQSEIQSAALEEIAAQKASGAPRDEMDDDLC